MGRACGNCKYCVDDPSINQSFCHANPPITTYTAERAGAAFTLVSADNPFFWCRLHRYSLKRLFRRRKKVA
jgi:hypothetical protein